MSGDDIDTLIHDFAEYVGVPPSTAAAIIHEALAGECEPLRILEPLTNGVVNHAGRQGNADS